MNILNLKLWKTGLLAGIMLAILLHPEGVGARTRNVTSLNDSGAGSLRQTIIDSAAGDTIIFSVTGTITLTSDSLLIDRDLTITGPGANLLTVSGNNSYTVFFIFSGTVNLSGLTITGGITGNGSTDGAGIANGGTLTVNNCAISENQGLYRDGGGIFNNGTLTVNNSTISGNSSARWGGGIYSYGVSTFNNCTISGNTATSGGAGGAVGPGTLALNNCTVSGNSAPCGAIYNSSATLTVFNTIIANNSGANGDVCGDVSSEGHNLVGQLVNSSGWVNTDLIGSILVPLDPQLGPLQDNGGPTFTMALQPTSAAIDAGDDAVLGPPFNLTTDQRGRPRKLGAHVDIGAVEYDPPQPGPNYVVTTLDDHNYGIAGTYDCSLREALNAAGGLLGGTITFAAGLQGTIYLTLGELFCFGYCSIVGPTDRAITISGNHRSRVFHVSRLLNLPASVSFANLAITDGQPSSYGGGIFVEPNAALDLNSCTIYNNLSNDSGGGIANNGTVTMANCTVSGNQALQGGGVYTYGGPVVMRNCTVALNTATTAGGGLYTYPVAGSSINVSSTLVADNSAPTHDDVIGAFTSSGYNLIGKFDSTSGTGGFANGVNHDLVGSIASPLNPIIGGLADNGGPTLTHALLAGSPAIDQGVSNGLTTDQRGRPRPSDFVNIANASGGDGSDIGAFEVQVLRVTTLADNVAGSLRNAILLTAPGDHVDFAPGVAGTITLTAGELVIGKNLSIDGPGAKVLTISGNNASRVFHITGGSSLISGLRIANGNTSGGGGGILMDAGTLNLNYCTVAACYAGYATGGGGIFLGTSARLSLVGTTISGNSTPDYGGGLYLFNGAYAFVLNSTISGNSTLDGTDAGWGGGIFVQSSGSTLGMYSSTVANNSSVNAGGGIYRYQGTVTLADTLVAGNTAPSGPDCKGTFVSSGYNLIGNSSGSTGFGAAGDQLNVNPLLGPLADNGGPTFTHALLTGSPAIDQGNTFGTTTDQRGLPRPYDFPSIPNASGGDGSDIGAFELQPLMVSRPLLTISLSGTGVVISWPSPSTGFVLQENTSAADSASWNNVLTTPNDDGTTKSVTVNPATGNRFYRLAQ